MSAQGGTVSEAPLHLLLAAFDAEAAARDALKTLKESRDEKIVGVQAAVAMRKDAEGQLQFEDVGMTPGKGALAGVALGAVVGVLTGGTVIALGALGALIGGLVGRKKRDSRFPTGGINQLAASLAPDSSALVIIMEPGWVVVLEKELEALGADVLSAPIPADITEQLDTDQAAAYAVLADELGIAGMRQGGSHGETKE
jgi:uncharacterized membrane protein